MAVSSGRHDNVISGNNITGAWAGIFYHSLNNDAMNNVIDGNTITNSLFGIYMDTTLNGVSITNNTISGNNWGIRNEDSQLNIIQYNNTFYWNLPREA